MRTYETLFIVHPEVAGDDLTALIEKYRRITSYNVCYTKLLRAFRTTAC